jgi:hypothetical protein
MEASNVAQVTLAPMTLYHPQHFEPIMAASNVAQVTLAPTTLYYPKQFWAHHGSKQ